VLKTRIYVISLTRVADNKTLPSFQSDEKELGIK
jgi:hypothetical protein